jgi:hypothetical protein
MSIRIRNPFLGKEKKAKQEKKAAPSQRKAASKQTKTNSSQAPEIEQQAKRMKSSARKKEWRGPIRVPTQDRLLAPSLLKSFSSPQGIANGVRSRKAF